MTAPKLQVQNVSKFYRRDDAMMAVLSEYLDFSSGRAEQPETPAVQVDLTAPKPAADAVAPRKGMSRADAERAFGKPTEASDRREGSVVVTTLVFVSGDQRMTAEFLEDVLIRYTITSR